MSSFMISINIKEMIRSMADIRRAYLGSVLNRAEKDELIRRVLCSVKQDYEKYAFDGRLLDSLREILPEDVFTEVYASAQHERCSKQFYHEAPMMRHLNEFLGHSTKDRRHSNACRAARVLLLKYMPKAELEPEDIDKVGLDIFSNSKGAAGAIARGTKEKNSDICLDVYHRIQTAISSGVSFSDIFVPTMCYHRSQLGGLLDESGHYNPDFIMKDRMVEGVDGGTTLFEASYFKPVYSLWKQHWRCYAGGKNPSELRLTIAEWRNHRHWIGTDFSKFDMHLPAWVIEEVFDIIKTLYFDAKYWTDIDWIAYNFINTVMLGPDGGVYRKHKGIPSGSFCTQIIGTVANLYMNLTGMAKMTGCIKTHDMITALESELVSCNHGLRMCAMGDDCLIFMLNRVTPEYINALASYITHIFGVEVNPGKTDYGTWREDPLFLKREWRAGGEYQDPKKLFINLIHPEHDRKYECYSPWHILYGMWVTYFYSFPLTCDREFFITKMEEENYTLEALRHIPLTELPGVWRGLGESPQELLYLWAKHHLRMG